MELRELRNGVAQGPELFVLGFMPVCLSLASIPLLLLPSGDAGSMVRRAFVAYGALITLSGVSFSAARAVESKRDTAYYRRAGQHFLLASLYLVPFAAIQFGLLWSVPELLAQAAWWKPYVGALRVLVWAVAFWLFLWCFTSTVAAYALLTKVLGDFKLAELQQPDAVPRDD